jgi:hypothetical protein
MSYSAMEPVRAGGSKNWVESPAEASRAQKRDDHWPGADATGYLHDSPTWKNSGRLTACGKKPPRWVQNGPSLHPQGCGGCSRFGPSQPPKFSGSRYSRLSCHDGAVSQWPRGANGWWMAAYHHEAIPLSLRELVSAPGQLSGSSLAATDKGLYIQNRAEWNTEKFSSEGTRGRGELESESESEDIS